MNEAIIVDRDTDTERLAHRPAAEYAMKQFPDITRAFAPASWPSACGQVQRGLVFLHAGMLANLPDCPACQQVEQAP